MTLVLRVMYDPTLDDEILRKLRHPKLRLNEENCDFTELEIKENKNILSFTARVTREVSLQQQTHDARAHLSNTCFILPIHTHYHHLKRISSSVATFFESEKR
jgi:hypothetical protein